MASPSPWGRGRKAGEREREGGELLESKGEEGGAGSSEWEWREGYLRESRCEYADWQAGKGGRVGRDRGASE